MLRISEEHHQREVQRLWANPTLCATARANSGGKEFVIVVLCCALLSAYLFCYCSNSDRGKFMYDILPDPKSPSDTESEVEDAYAARALHLIQVCAVLL